MSRTLEQALLALPVMPGPESDRIVSPSVIVQTVHLSLGGILLNVFTSSGP